MLQKRLKLYKIINLNVPVIQFSTISVMEKVKHLFLDHCINPVISYLDQQINILKGWISFKYPLLLNIVLKNLTNVLNLKENRESSQHGQISKNL